jgi:hypothetical protein
MSATRQAVAAVGDQHDAAHAFGLQLAQQPRHREFAIHRLAAGHRHRVVEEDLVGDAAGRLAVVGRLKAATAWRMARMPEWK